MVSHSLNYFLGVPRQVFSIFLVFRIFPSFTTYLTFLLAGSVYRLYPSHGAAGGVWRARSFQSRSCTPRLPSRPKRWDAAVRPHADHILFRDANRLDKSSNSLSSRAEPKSSRTKSKSQPLASRECLSAYLFELLRRRKECLWY